MNTFQSQREHLQDLLKALVQLNKGKHWWSGLLEPQQISVQGKLLTEAQIVTVIETSLYSLLASMRNVVYERERFGNELAAAQEEIELRLQERSNLLDALRGARFELERAKQVIQARDQDSVKSRDLYQDELRKARGESQDELRNLRKERGSLRGEVEQVKKKNDELTRQVQTQQNELDRNKKLLAGAQAEKRLLLQANEERVAELEKELEKQTAFLREGALRDEKAASFEGYMADLKAAAAIGTRIAIQRYELGNGSVETLYYAYNPSDVADSLVEFRDILTAIEREKAKEAQKRRMVLTEDILLSFAGVLGFFNLFQYLIQSKGTAERKFLLALLNLVLPNSYVTKLASGLNAIAWLADAKNFPLRGKVPAGSCSFTVSSSNISEEEIVREIIVFELSRLLDFRKSLCIVLPKVAPLLQEEEDTLQGQDPQASSGPSIQIKHRHGEGEHYFLIQLSDSANGLRQPLWIPFFVDRKGDEIPMEDEERDDQLKKLEELEWINYRRAL